MNTKISAPWYTFVRELTAMFGRDQDVGILYDDENQVLTIEVTKYEKAEALKKLLPKSKSWGNVNLQIVIKYDPHVSTIEDTIKQVFENNPAFKYVFTFQTDTNPITYVIFDKKVVQYWNDDMHDPHGVTSSLYENIARDVFDDKNGLIFSTDSDESSRFSHEKTYSKSQPTNEEIATWEKYNGAGSYSDGSTPKNDKKPIQVKDEKTFKSIFTFKKEE